MSESSTHQLVGVVTKMFPTFGYINNQIFFQRKCVIGPMVEVGDNVAASAVYQPNMPIKWNAEKVWRVQESSRTHPKGDTEEAKYVDKSRSKSPIRSRDSRAPHSRDTSSTRDILKTSSDRKRRDTPEHLRSSSRDIVSSDRSDHKRRRISPTVAARSRSPARRQTRGRNESDSKALLNMREMLIPDIHVRFPGLLAPVDLYRLVCHWQDSFPLLKPLQPDHSTYFQVLKSTPAESVVKSRADSRFFVNVLLLSMPSISTLQDKTVTRAEGPDHEKPPLRKYIKILSVLKPKEQFKAFGGPWNPELDGGDPLSNPEVLIKTAIRVCKEQIGLDLSYCTQWHRFLEFRYSRTEGSTARPTSVLFPGSQLWGRSFTDSSHKNSNPAKPFHRIVFYFIPNIWSIMPSTDTWPDLKNAMEIALSGGAEQSFPLSSFELKSILGKTSEDSVPPSRDSEEDTSVKSQDLGGSTSEIKSVMQAQISSTQKSLPASISSVGITEVSMTESVSNDEPGLKSPSATSAVVDEDGVCKALKKTHDELNLSAMKVSELRDQLKVRNLPADGIKAQLLSRLKTAIEKEAEQAKKLEEERKRKEKEIQEARAAKEEEQKKSESIKPMEATPVPMTNSTKVSLRNYPSVIIQNRLQSDCTIQAVTLDNIFEMKAAIMDSRAYELMVCAQSLLDMIRRDSIFTLFRALVSAGDRGVQAKAKAKLNSERHDHTGSRGRDSKTEKAPDVIPFTVDVPLLCACTFLDPACREYFLAEDVEDMISTLGLPVSRYQIRSLITKVSDGHRIYYRSLTDAEVSPSSVRSTSLYSEIDDDEYLLELIRGGDAILDEQKDAKLPMGSVLVLRGSNLEGAQLAATDCTAPTVFAQNIALLECERSKLKKQLQCKAEEIERLRVLAEQIPNLKSKLETANASVDDYRRRLRTERDRIHYVHRILEQQIADLDSSRSSLRQAAHRLRAHDDDSSTSRKAASESKTQDSDNSKSKPEEKLLVQEKRDVLKEDQPDATMEPVKIAHENANDEENPPAEIALAASTESEYTVKDVSVSLAVLKSPEPKLVNGIDDNVVHGESMDAPIVIDLDDASVPKCETTA